MNSLRCGIKGPQRKMYEVVTKESKDNRVLERNVPEIVLGVPLSKQGPAESTGPCAAVLPAETGSETWILEEKIISAQASSYPPHPETTLYIHRPT